MFERFTESAIKAIMLAQEEARRMRLNKVGKEQIFLALIFDKHTAAGEALKQAGLTLDAARQKLDHLNDQAPARTGIEIPFTESAKLTLEAAWDAARQQHKNFIDTGHLLIGLLNVKEGFTVTEHFDVEADFLRNKAVESQNARNSHIETSSSSAVYETGSKATVKDSEQQITSGNFFSRFTEHAIKSIMYAQEESRRIGHNRVGTEQLLLGLFDLNSGLAYEELDKSNATPKSLRAAVEASIGRGSGFAAIEIPFTPRCKRAMERANALSSKLEHDCINSGHLLVGILDLEDCTAQKVLTDCKVDCKELNDNVLTALNSDRHEK